MEEQQPTPKKCKARAHIESIARENTLDGRIVGTRLESLLTNCLEILSNQLYEKSTHFLLELIQNADDNTYDHPNATLSFSYKPGGLRIDCNEIGFRAENVEALCAINKSTKSGKTNDGEYIGEKGIGFKSVFKAADIVWISSREYQFQFDRTHFLGMVTPVWATFPESTTPGWTSMYLRLSKDYEEQTLRDELIAFDLHLMIFLRRIKEINVSVVSRSGQTYRKTVRKIEQEHNEDRLILLESDDNTFKYTIRTFTITNLPNEPKRPNWTQTKILLAFPSINRLEKPRAIPQKIYAFLPIRNYGFKFLIQGDFLLTASREDIESTLPWNRRLRDALAEAFLESVDRFNQGDLKYVWPHYVPSTGEVPSTFLAPTITSILTQLGKKPCLESCAATMVQPVSMKYTSGDCFVDEEGYPFTCTSQNAHRYLSPKYPEWVVESLDNLGVSKLTARDFLDDLALAIKQDPVTFYRRSNDWHSQLSVALVKISTEKELLSTMEDISLIPLQDGAWTSARGKAMFFAKNESSLEIPSGIDVLIVDSTAGLDPNRRKLFIALGVKTWEAPEICRLVLKVHESSDFDPKLLKTNQLISHAAFLYNASWQPPDDADIWFATMQDDRCKGRKLYIPGSAEPNSPAGRVFAQLQKKFSVIHIDYLNAPGLGLGWPSWLVTNLGLSMVPRLIHPHVKPRPQPIAQTIQELSSANVEPEPDNPRIDADDSLDRPPAQGNEALRDYQTQLMLLEQQNKKRLLMARQEVVHSPSLTQVQMGIDPATRGAGVTPQPVAPRTLVPPTELPSRSDSPTSTPNVIKPVENISDYDFDASHREKQSPRAARFQDEAKIAEKAASKESKESTESSSLATDTDDSFGLSEEFTFMSGHCHSSDILQILKDNWTEYSQWIDGAHMKWQGSNFVKSCYQLKSDIAACSVQTAKAQLPLRESVLPMIDRHLDESYVTPSLQIELPEDSEWSLLNHFGVLIKGDIHYYLRCLIGISGDQHPDINTIIYIYEKIDGQYTGNEELVRAAFYERDIVYVPWIASTSTESTGWTNMRECASKNYALDSEYKSCAYLFRSLLLPSGDPIAPLVFTASLISSSSKLEEIARLFRDINTALKDVTTTRAAQLLRPLQKKPIFPVIDDCQRGTYSRLLDAHNTSWFIADRAPIRKSFLGKLPLLALSAQDLLPLQDLFRALGLNDRLLSMRVTSKTDPMGRISTHWRHTENFRSKRPFIKALIPPSHRDKIGIECQLHGIRVSVATHISQQFSLRNAGCTVKGSPTRGQVARSDAGNVLNLFITEEGASEESPPYELVNIVADACQISDPNHRSLLHTALSSSNIRSLISTFQQQGLYIKGIDMGNSSMRYQAQRSHTLRIPSPFWGHLNGVKRNSQFLPESTRAMGFGRAGRIFHTYEDRRLPMIGISEEDRLIFGGVNVQRFMVENEKIDNWDNLQHLGEHMFSKLLRNYLGPVYSPERHWTSEFRSQSGYSAFTNLTSCAAFTLNDREVQDRMTDFVLEYGQSKMPTWSKRLQLERPVYHIDVAVNMHVKESYFVLRTALIDRMQRFKMHDNLDEPHTDVYILVQVCNVRSEELISIEILLDPWRLLDSNSLSIETTWFVRGALTREDSGPGKKRPKVHQPTLSWASPAIPREQATPGPRTRRGGEKYTYRPLAHGHIRLLYLLPGNTNESLHGMIFHTPYDSGKDYQSLSYVWGSDRRTYEIITADGIVNITKSLSIALHGLRRKDKAITLWVDALCINQEDNNEKAQQIRLLPRIFQNATFTYAFLDGAKKFEGAIEMLMQIRVKAALEEQQQALVKYYEESQSDLEDGHELTKKPYAKEKFGDDHVMIGMQWPEDLRTVPISWKDRCIPLESDPVWSSVEALFGLPWFRRVWIVQEIVASPNVQVICGERRIDWSDLHCAVEIIDRQLQLNESSSLSMSLEPFLALAAQREWEARQYRWSLIMLLEHFRYAESTISRDRLFALLGLASDANEPAFAPDYSCSFEEVVLRFARGFVRQGRGLQLLYRAGLTRHSDRFPSWIPDWTVKRPSGLHDASESGETFSASGPLQPNIRCEPDTNGLIADGYEIDVVQYITTSSNVNAEWGTYFDEIDEMLASAVLSPSRDSLDAIKWKVPIAGALYPKSALHGVTDLQSSYEAFRNYLNIKRKGKQVSGNREVHEGFLRYTAEIQTMQAASYQKQSMSYVAALQGTLSGWKFIVTKRGYVGVVPNLTQAGDIVAVLKGSLVPFILKKSESRPNTFRLVGECYLHSVMNGEGLTLYNIAEREFYIH